VAERIASWMGKEDYREAAYRWIIEQSGSLMIILALIDTSVPIKYVEILVMVALVNSVLPAGDILGFFLMASQAPASACVKNKGWKSYWKRA
jgi:hypothetical protein